MKRELVIVLKDGTRIPLKISRAVSVDLQHQMLHIDGLKDGTFRLVWSESLVKEFKDIDRIDIVRED